jgi:hypothetical protein
MILALSWSDAGTVAVIDIPLALADKGAIDAASAMATMIMNLARMIAHLR